jgi:LuxR family maltose regulon positive regulatory protein
MLIKTKLGMPPLRHTMLRRTSLLQKLSTAKERRLILIVGQPGSGKTSLASQWIGQEGLRSVWYSLDENDNESDLFLRYLLTALSKTDDGFARASKPLLKGRKRLSPQEVIPVIVQYAVDLSADLYLVLDDYHAITAREIHDTLSHLLNYLPPKMHLILICRHECPFSLSKLKVRNQMVEISDADLRFTEKEGEQFFAEIIPVEIPIDQIRELTRHTEGWVGGLQLIGLTLQGRKDPTDLSDVLNSARRAAAEYLIDEVVNVQPEKVRTFLYETVFLNRFNAELCNEITGMEEAREILDYLHRINLFVVPLDNEDTWYRYHNLFSEAIRVRGRTILPDIMDKTRRKAARWFAQNGYLEDAFQHALATEDFEFVAELLEDYLYILYERYEVENAVRWLSSLPSEVFLRHPLLRLNQHAHKIPSLELEDIELVLKDIEDNYETALARYEGANKTRFEGTFTFMKYVLPFYRDQTTVNVDWMNEGLRKIPKEDEPNRHALQIAIAGSYLHQGKPSVAERALQAMSISILSSASFFRRIQWFKYVAEVKRWQGHLGQAEAILREAFSFLNQNKLNDTALEYFLYLPMALIFYSRNEPEEAWRYATVALKYAERVRFLDDIVTGNFVLSKILTAMGQPEKIDACIREMEFASKGSLPRLIAVSEAYIALLTLGQGEVGFAEKWAEQRRLSIDEPFSVRFLFEGLAQARLYYAKEMYLEAAQMLKKLHDSCVEQDMRGGLLQIDLLYGATLYALSHHRQAKMLITETLAFAEAEGHIQPFVDYWPLISPILLDMARSSSADHRSNHLFTILKASGISPESALMKRHALKGENADLTLRELEVLKLVSAGFSNKEIADRSFVSLDTVKTHVRHIFEKLDVKTRLQASLKAKEMNLLK